MKIIFLGTGASGGTAGVGKSKRKESSLLIKNGASILIDVTRDFSKQANLISHLNYVFLTHGHQDACGGIKQLDDWLQDKKASPVFVYAHPKTIAVIESRYKASLFSNENKLLTHCQFVAVSENQHIKIADLKAIPLEVPHSFNAKFPTFAWKFREAKTVVYASDIAALTKKFKTFCKGADLLIIDGATWRRKIFSHLRADESLPEICRWNIGKIILTQIGKSAPKYEELEKEVKKICSKVRSSFDGMKIRL